MNKHKFPENIWITFEYNSIFHVGRTLTLQGLQSVACVSSEGTISYIPFDKIENVKQLKLLKDVKFSKYNKSKRDIDFDTNSN